MSLQTVLNHFDLNSTQLIAAGGEGQVYRLNELQVVKIYKGSLLEKLHKLQGVCALLNKFIFSFQIPAIYQFGELDGYSYSVEKFLPGTPGQVVFAKLKSEDRKKILWQLIVLTKELQQVSVIDHPYGSVLGSNTERSKSWKETLLNNLMQEPVKAFGPAADHDIQNIREVFAAFVTEAQAIPEHPTKHFVHGDIYLENILIDEETLTISALLDFSTLSMVGDRLLDVAGLITFLTASEGVEQLDQDFLRAEIYSSLSDREKHLVEIYSKYFALFFINSQKSSPRTYKWCLHLLEKFYTLVREQIS